MLQTKPERALALELARGFEQQHRARASAEANRAAALLREVCDAENVVDDVGAGGGGDARALRSVVAVYARFESMPAHVQAKLVALAEGLLPEMLVDRAAADLSTLQAMVRRIYTHITYTNRSKN